MSSKSGRKPDIKVITADVGFKFLKVMPFLIHPKLETLHRQL
jgi:hypothetical protein